MTTLNRAFLCLAIALSISPCCVGQRNPSPASCPVLATVASTKVPIDQGGDNIVIWFYNRGTKTTNGIEFTLVMLDASGNRYPASHKYVGTGNTKPDSGDVVFYSTDDEAKYFGEAWKKIEGMEVYITSISFTDATAWKPKPGVACKSSFLNSNYKNQMAEMDKKIERKRKAIRKKWNRDHPEDPWPEPSPTPK